MTDNLNPPITIIPAGLPRIRYKNYSHVDFGESTIEFKTNTEVFRFLEREKLNAGGKILGVFIRHV